MALALYRKYRPATFAEVVGQEHVTEPLRTALAAGRVNHAYLFSGPRGCGKTSSARILARSLNCENGPTPDPCGRCASCVALAPEGPGSIDVVELDAASHGGVDDARDLRDRAFYAPADSRYRVFIIDEAHMVTTQGFNALLKIVEEPPEHLVFIFATTEPDKVLSTIRSRTHHYPFRLLPPGTLRRLLERICVDEGVVVEPSVFPLVVRAGGGSARDSLSVLDQLLAGAGAEGVRYERAVALLGVSDVGLIDDVVDALAAGDGAAVFGAVERLVEAGHDPRRFATDLLERFRDLTLLQAIPDAAGRGLVDAPEDTVARMTAQADRIPPAALARYGEIVHSGLIEMRGATAPRLLLELLCARMLLPAASADDAALLHRLELLERRLTLVPSAAGGAERATPAGESPAATRQAATGQAATSQAAPPATVSGGAAGLGGSADTERPGAGAAEATVPSVAAEPIQQSATSAPAGGSAPQPAATDQRLDAAAVRRAWPGLLDEVRERSRVTQVLLSSATVHAVEGDTLVLTIGSAALARQLSEDRHVEKIVAALRAVLGGQWRIRCELADAGQRPATHGTPSAPASGHQAPGYQASGHQTSGYSAGGRQTGGTSAGAQAAQRAERQSDERQSDERQSDERQSDERQSDERQSDERPSSERQSGARASGERQSPQRSERASAQRPSAQRASAQNQGRRTDAARAPANGRGLPSGEIPPPPEPPEPDQLEDDEDAMLAEAAEAPERGAGERRDPEEVALELLANTLGARKIEER